MPLKQVIIVNTDLKMSKGKIAAQVAHGEVLYLESLPDICVSPEDEVKLNRYYRWRELEVEPIGVMKKVVLASPEIHIYTLITKLKTDGIGHFVVYDLGFTQVEKGSLTCLVTEPIEESICDEVFGHLKLL